MATDRLRCEQCGREGTRGFKVIPATTHEPTGQVVGPYTVCASGNACHRRGLSLLRGALTSPAGPVKEGPEEARHG